jgi:predicted nucleotidyltransferase
MAMLQLPADFRDFLRLLNSHGVEYLVVGGYAVAYHGRPRATGDLDLWIAVHPRNAANVVQTLQEFGFTSDEIAVDLFLRENQVIRMGVPPLRIEILTSVSGVAFDECYRAKVRDVVDGIPVDFIDLDHLKRNKQAAGRHKDLDDLESLP